jgi:hypothetical protein
MAPKSIIPTDLRTLTTIANFSIAFAIVPIGFYIELTNRLFQYSIISPLNIICLGYQF